MNRNKGRFPKKLLLGSSSDEAYRCTYCFGYSGSLVHFAGEMLATRFTPGQEVSPRS